MKTLHRVFFALSCLTVAFAQPAITNYNGRQVAANEIIVRLKDASPATLAGVQSWAAAGEVFHSLSATVPLQLLHSNTRDVGALVSAFGHANGVAYVEPNYVVRNVASPNDPAYSQLWAMPVIGAPAAWDIATGSAANVIGVIDTGIDYTHPDLAPNMWSAPSAFTVNIGGMAITCPAGSHGFNAIANSCDPMDDQYHGTHVSGTIGAAGNNSVGVAGVNWTTRLMGLKFLAASGSGLLSDAIKAMEFAIQTKALFAGTATPVNLRVLSASWGGTDFSQSLLDEINKAGSNNMLFVAAAGNSGTNNDQAPFYPAGFSASNLISVAATDASDSVASFSNYGPSTVHLGAPGVSILSTMPGNQYAYLSGTSMAAPQVSGAAMLTLATCPGLDTIGLKSQLLNAVDPESALAGRTITGGRLNVGKAVSACSGPGISVSPATGSGSSQRFTFTFPGASNAVTMNMLINSSLTGAGACFLIYEPPANTIDLVDNSGNNVGGRLTPGSGGTLSNSQCSIAGSSVAVSNTGNSITVAATVTFASGFAGPKTIWATWYSAAGQQGIWQSVGSWNVTASGNSVVPSSGSGPSQQFTFTFPGASNADSVNMLIHSALSSAGGCYVIYERAANTFDIVDDAGNIASRAAPGSNVVLSNSQCSIPVSSVSIANSGSAIVVSATVNFSPSFAGTKTIWAAWYSGGTEQGGWQAVGSWNVTGMTAMSGPSVSPASGSGSSQRFTFTFPGAASAGSVNILIHSALSAAGGCYFIYEPGPNTFDMVDDAGNIAARLVPGSGGNLSDSQCSIPLSSVSVTSSGSTITVAATVTFTPSFTGPKTIWAASYASGVLQSAWQPIGSWNVQ
jgi:subtilisin family serine protease